MAGKFVKFAFILIISCALIVRVAEAAPGDKNANNEDFQGGPRDDTPLFIKEINKYATNSYFLKFANTFFRRHKTFNLLNDDSELQS